MPRNAISLGFVPETSLTIAMAQIIVLSLIAIPLAGCGADGQGGPAIRLSPHRPTLHRVKVPPDSSFPRQNQPPGKLHGFCANTQLQTRPQVRCRRF